MTTPTLRVVQCSGAERRVVLELATGGVDEFLTELRRRFARPDGVLWAGAAAGELTAVGWTTAVPDANRRHQPSVLGRLDMPLDYLEILAVDADGQPMLERWADDDATSELLSRAGLLPDRGLAGDNAAMLRARLDGTPHTGAKPQGAAVRRALDLGVNARRLGIVHLAAVAWCRAGALLHEVGEHDLALMLHRRALGALADNAGPEVLAGCHSDVGHALWHVGRPEDAIAQLEQARQLLSDIDGADAEELRRVLLRLSVPLADVGRTDDALALIGAVADDEDCTDGATHARTAHARAYVLRAAGRTDEALEHGKRALALTVDHSSLSAAAEVHALLADLFAASGDFVAATNHQMAIRNAEAELQRSIVV